MEITTLSLPNLQNMPKLPQLSHCFSLHDLKQKNRYLHFEEKRRGIYCMFYTEKYETLTCSGVDDSLSYE